MKKNMVILPLATLLLFLLLSVTPTRATEAAGKVLDSEGNPLEWGSEYYIRSARVGWRGGITRTSKQGPLGCPLFLTEAPSEVDPGTPVKFLPDPELTQTPHIHLSSKFKIDSGFSAYCRDDGIWRLHLDAWTRSFIVTAGGDGFSDLPRTWFTLEESKTDDGPVYRIATKVGDLGLFKDMTGFKILGVDVHDPETFLFTKKKTDVDVSVIRSVTN